MFCTVVAVFLLTNASRGPSALAEPLVTAYLNDNAQTPLDRFVSICYTSKFATNTVKSRTNGAYALVYRTYMVDRLRRDKHGGPSSILLIPASSVQRRNFF